MSLKGTDLALVSARIGVARIGAFRLGFAPDDVEGPGTVGPGEYGWQEVKPEDDGEEWHVVDAWSMCAEKCVASFTMTAGPIVPGDLVQFTDTTIPGAEITFWHWDFGDGSYSDIQNPSHIFAYAGDYRVVLWASGPRGSCHTPLDLAPLAPGAPWVPGAPIVIEPIATIVQGTVTFDPDPYDGPEPCEGNTVELRDGLGVVRATTTTNAAGFYEFVSPVVTMLQGDAFTIYVQQNGGGQLDTWDDVHLWAVNVTTVIDIEMLENIQ